ncbi:MAG: hypothetical protein U1G07_15550 [Verrucomicrobiota bacterium]
MSVHPAVDELSRRVLRLIEEASNASAGREEDFTALAMALFDRQFADIPVYRRFCEARGVGPGRVTAWKEIPAMPTRAFKEFDLSSLPLEGRPTFFLSSGTGSIAERSRHYHDPASLEIYEASLWSWFRRHVLPERGSFDGMGEGMRLVALTPPPELAPHSSLVHMFGTIARRGRFDAATFAARTDDTGIWHLDLELTTQWLREATAVSQPVLLLGPAFSYVHLLDRWAETGQSFHLAPGSRALETGGYKGRSRVLPKAELHEGIMDRCGIPGSHIVTEYGMSELSSQAYDRVVGEAPGRGAGCFRFPPWARAWMASPETGKEVADGEIGMIRVVDLANVYSLLSIQTEDLGRRCGDGFEWIGRANLVESRGCSLMLE